MNGATMQFNEPQTLDARYNECESSKSTDPTVRWRCQKILVSVPAVH